MLFASLGDYREYANCILIFSHSFTTTDPVSGGATGATPYSSRPAVVVGEKAVEAAISDGLYPVIDKTIDVFAVPSAEGMYYQPRF